MPILSRPSSSLTPGIGLSAGVVRWTPAKKAANSQKLLPSCYTSIGVIVALELRIRAWIPQEKRGEALEARFSGWSSLAI